MAFPRFSRLFLVLTALLVSSCSRAEAPAPDSAKPDPSKIVGWVQLTGNGAEARALAVDGVCPTATLDGRSTPMTVRAAANADFPTVCAMSVPPSARKLDISGKVMPLPGLSPQRIVVIGDTGCRIKGFHAQHCQDPDAWPFARVAALAAAKAPDLVIHVGDYYYRESPCPLNMPACAGSPYGDRIATWKAEFFDPAKPLMDRAPMVFVRGNHESCARGGLGWFRLLDAAAWQAGCADTAKAFVAHLGALSLGITDSSLAEDRYSPPEAVAAMTPQFDLLAKALGPGESFILTHKPIWAAVPVARLGPMGAMWVQLNHTEQVASEGRILPGTSMVISGHVHHFAAYAYGPTRPAQLVAGEGGDEPMTEDRPGFDRKAVKVGGMAAAKLSFARYGYVLMERSPTGWRIEARDLQDKVAALCTLKGRDLSCEEGAPVPVRRPAQP